MFLLIHGFELLRHMAKKSSGLQAVTLTGMSTNHHFIFPQKYSKKVTTQKKRPFLLLPKLPTFRSPDSVLHWHCLRLLRWEFWVIKIDQGKNQSQWPDLMISLLWQSHRFFLRNLHCPLLTRPTTQESWVVQVFSFRPPFLQWEVLFHYLYGQLWVINY